ncbi:DHH family phosphoesterase [Spirochaeta isovalerica]|uniref:Phosphoesterase RecJ-like protein n=1 Tax=Spirochaeta isovalerica TaxID=150 RepID=A0A841RCU2_9SPIO|nr:bifunctional oligoribonuclease/PAP phosphatase NrnA [Spirochaeta isovalerica]MBB6481057.1 phosphoesterase RecJ-like protein [Spirochaeta isovalerica]
MERDARPILDALEKYDNFIIAGHQEPDGDCLCSQMALASFLKRKGKSAKLVSAGPFNRPEIRSWEKFFSSTIRNDDLQGSTLGIITDCSSPDRTGPLGEQLERLPLMVIDHHSAGEDFGDYRFIDSNSPSTTLLVQQLIEASGMELTEEEAEFIFLGFCTDTGFFRHIGSGKPDVFQAVSRLVEAGVSPNATHRVMTGGRTHGSRRLLGRILERSRLHFDGKLIISWETLEDRRELGTDDRDSDSMYQMLQSIGGVESVAVIQEEDLDLFSVGLRSNFDTDVGAIAKSFGGGGHRKAAGCTLKGSKDEVLDRIIKAFQILNNS